MEDEILKALASNIEANIQEVFAMLNNVSVRLEAIESQFENTRKVEG